MIFSEIISEESGRKRSILSPYWVSVVIEASGNSLRNNSRQGNNLMTSPIPPICITNILDIFLFFGMSRSVIGHRILPARQNNLKRGYLKYLFIKKSIEDNFSVIGSDYNFQLCYKPDIMLSDKIE
ncbi:MAG: hypothetical protein A2W23_06905 [Planctomycetes bacterium RBG_16_43_13]|nr:MAG: hypothetical protein A2W23_06905 [Planctomycetes bacterium RBG_16_43_13]